MGADANSESTSTNITETTTTSINESFNQAFSRVENLSDVGNISLSLGDDFDGGGFRLGPVLLGAAAFIGGIFLLRKAT